MNFIKVFSVDQTEYLININDISRVYKHRFYEDGIHKVCVALVCTSQEDPIKILGNADKIFKELEDKTVISDLTTITYQ